VYSSDLENNHSWDINVHVTDTDLVFVINNCDKISLVQPNALDKT